VEAQYWGGTGDAAIDAGAGLAAIGWLPDRTEVTNMLSSMAIVIARS